MLPDERGRRGNSLGARALCILCIPPSKISVSRALLTVAVKPPTLPASTLTLTPET